MPNKPLIKKFKRILIFIIKLPYKIVKSLLIFIKCVLVWIYKKLIKPIFAYFNCPIEQKRERWEIWKLRSITFYNFSKFLIYFLLAIILFLYILSLYKGEYLKIGNSIIDLSSIQDYINKKLMP